MIRTERFADVLVVTLDRPDQRNALSTALFAALAAAIDAAAADSTLRALVLTGAGGAFCAGADLREVRHLTTADDATTLAEQGLRLCDALAALPFPVIAALTGPAFGGGAELALACDLRVADEGARIAFKHARMAVTTAWGTLARLVATVGHAAAARALYTAEELDAAEATRLGLVDRVVPAGDAVTAALAWAEAIAAGSPAAIRAQKRLLTAARAALARELAPLEREAFVATWTSADHAEAVAAYFERRAPAWSTPT